MQVTVVINTDNAAFSDGNLQSEVARILRNAAQLSEDGRIDLNDDGDSFPLSDINGNKVGRISVEE